MYIFFKFTWNTLQIDTLGHQIRLSKFKKIEIISSISSDPSGMKLEINYKKKTQNHTTTPRLHNMLLNNEWSNNEIKEENKRYFETNENANTMIKKKSVGYSQTCSIKILRGKFILIQTYLKKQANKKLK